MENRYLVIQGFAEDREEAIRICGEALYKAGFVSEQFGELCVNREREYPTGLPTAIPTAIPHVKDDGIVENSVCFMKLDKPVIFQRMDDDTDEISTDMIFNLAIKEPTKHLKVLQNMMSFLNDSDVLLKCKTLSDAELIDYLQKHIG